MLQSKKRGKGGGGVGLTSEHREGCSHGGIKLIEGMRRMNTVERGRD